MSGIAKYSPLTMVVQIWLSIFGSHFARILKAKVVMCITDADDFVHVNAVALWGDY
jgi:hypothetical protein